MRACPILLKLLFQMRECPTLPYAAKRRCVRIVDALSRNHKVKCVTGSDRTPALLRHGDPDHPWTPLIRGPARSVDVGRRQDEATAQKKNRPLFVFCSLFCFFQSIAPTKPSQAPGSPAGCGASGSCAAGSGAGGCAAGGLGSGNWVPQGDRGRVPRARRGIGHHVHGRHVVRGRNHQPETLHPFPDDAKLCPAAHQPLWETVSLASWP